MIYILNIKKKIEISIFKIFNIYFFCNIFILFIKFDF